MFNFKNLIIHLAGICFCALQFSSVQFSHSVVSDSLRPKGPQHTRPPLYHQLLEFTQTHIHWVGDAIQPSHPLSSPSPPDPNPSQHQGLFQWVRSSHQMVKVLEFQLQHQSFQWTLRTDLLAVQGTLKSLLQHHRVVKLTKINNTMVVARGWEEGRVSVKWLQSFSFARGKLFWIRLVAA